jgi:hypothetical protein
MTGHAHPDRDGNGYFVVSDDPGATVKEAAEIGREPRHLGHATQCEPELRGGCDCEAAEVFVAGALAEEEEPFVEAAVGGEDLAAGIKRPGPAEAALR